MSKRVREKSNMTKDTLLTIAKIGIIIIALGTSPHGLTAIAKRYFKDLNKQKIRRRAQKLRELEEKNLITIEEIEKDKFKIYLTQHGQKIIKIYKFDDMKLSVPKKWDGQWHIIIYDIPKELKKASSVLSKKLRAFGLYSLQKSIWISPYSYEIELKFFCQVLEIPFKKHFECFTTKTPPKRQTLYNFFRL